MPESLRMRVVEAGVREYESLVDADAEDASWRSTEEYVLHVFDAMLVVLIANVGEWVEECYPEAPLVVNAVRRVMAGDLVEALRESP